MADTYNDGGMVINPQPVTINEVIYIIESIDVTTPTTVVESLDEDGLPNKQYLAKGFTTGSATLQLASSETALPPLLGSFTVTLVGGGSLTFIISEVGQTWATNTETKVNIGIRLRINTPPGD